MKNYFVLSLIVLAFPCLLLAQFGSIERLFNSGGKYTLGIAPATSKNPGFVYGGGGQVYYPRGEGFSTVFFLPTPPDQGIDEIRHIDIDNDQDWDFITLRGDKKLVLYVNEGNESFRQSKILHSFDWQAKNLEVVDLDDDQDSDFILYGEHAGFTSYNRAIVMFLNDGQGNFTEKSFRVPIAYPNLLLVDNFDKGKDPDVVYTGYSEVFWVKDVGTGKYNSQKMDLTTGQIIKLRAFDWDQDQDLDLLYITITGLYMLENTQENGFLAPKKLLHHDSSIFTDFNMADIDQDQDLDLIFASDYWHNLLLYKREGSVLDTMPQVIGQDLQYAEVIELGDIDGDKDLDIIFGTSLENYAILYRNNDGSLQRQLLDGRISDGVSDWKFVDLDNDSLPEIIPAFDWAIQNLGPKGFSLRDLHDSLSYSWRTKYDQRIHSWGDINGDNRVDLVVMQNGCLYSFLNQEKHFSFLERIICSGLDFHDDFQGLMDINQDGKPDLVYYVTKRGFFERFWAVRFNDGTGHFGAETPLPICCSSSDFGNTIALEDLNNDGVPELILLEHYGASYFNKGLGQGNYDPNVVAIAAHNDFESRILKAQIADWNGDGFLDIVGYYQGQFVYIPNLGDLKFGKREKIANLNADVAVKAADGNGDGHLDLFYTAYNKVYFQPHKNGQALRSAIPIAFSRELVYDLNWANIELVDIDHDQDLDLFVTDRNFSSIYMARNYSELATLSGKVFWDINQDTLLNVNEPPIPHAKLSLTPSAKATYTNDDGSYVFFTGTGTYELSAKTSDCWVPLDTNRVSITVGGESKAYSFPYIRSIEDTTNILTNLQYGFTRCHSSSSAWLSVRNVGCSEPNIKLKLAKNRAIKFLGYDLPPSLETSDTVYWNISNLLPGAEQRIRLTIGLPGVEFFDQELSIISITQVENVDAQSKTTRLDAFPFFLRCSYDPNDKQVLPFSTLHDNPVYFKNNQLDYTIRFQNTGNDTAFKVVIVDTLHHTFDWSTFTPLRSSHPYRAELDQAKGIVQFIFDPIVLPDSSTNEAGSMGFVAYSISFYTNAKLGTRLTNRAGIYFDQNPVILTNTVLSTISDLRTSTKKTPQARDIIDFSVVPNPNSGTFQLLLKSWPLAEPELGIQIIDQLGRPVFQTQIRGQNSTIISLPELPAGLYFALLKSKTGATFGMQKFILQP